MKTNVDSNIDMKIEKEKTIVKLMIIRYCKGRKHFERPYISRDKTKVEVK